MNLAQSIHQAIDDIVASEAIEKAIAEQLEKTIVSVLKDQLRHYSDFGKQIEDAVKKSLELHDDFDLPSYNHAILQIVRAKVQGLTRHSIEKEVAEQMEKLLQPAPETITLSALVEQFIEFVKERRKYDCVCHGEDAISFHVSESERTDGFRTIYLGV